MLIFLIILLISVVLFCVPFFIEDTWYLIVFSLVILVFNLLVGLCAIRNNANPNIKNYTELNSIYEYTISHDSIPLKTKTDLYNECALFNTKLDDNDKYHNSSWIGIYYPDLGENRKLMKPFDINKIK